MEYKDLKKKFPILAKEIEKKVARSRISIEGVRTEQPEKTDKRELLGYEPDVIDFLRRCKSDDEGFEIIEYMVKRGEISKTYGDRLKRQINLRGLSSFGPRKVWGYYEREKKP